MALADLHVDWRSSMPYPPAYDAATMPEQGRNGHLHAHAARVPILGLAFVAVGIWLLLGNLGLLDWAGGRRVGPVLLVALGLVLLVRRVR